MPRDIPGQADWLAPPSSRPRRAPPKKLVLRTQRQAEHDLQIACAKLFLQILLPDVAWTAIDSAFSLNMTIGRNGRPIGFAEVAKRKERGVRPGVPDFVFWRAGYGYAIELKAGDGVLSDDQQSFLKEMIHAGVEVAVCWTLDQVLQRLRQWELCRNVRGVA